MSDRNSNGEILIEAMKTTREINLLSTEREIRIHKACVKPVKIYEAEPKADIAKSKQLIQPTEIMP